MLHALRRHLNPATVLALLALVFATTGGAYAVTSRGGSPHAAAAKAKAKSKGKTGPRGPAGPRGATGAAGPAGPAGATGPSGPKGEAGSAGAKGETGAAGTNGQEGASVVSAQLGPEEGGCREGGSQFTVGGQTTVACNGEKGEPGESGKAGFTKTLPEGETETGTFVVQFTEPTAAARLLPISFPIPLPVALAGNVVHYVTREEQNKQNGKTPPEECQGTAEAPKAKKGSLCVYEGYAHKPEAAPGEEQFLSAAPLDATAGEGSNPEPGASTAGALLEVFYEGPSGLVNLSGTWAVSAS